jgi:hypothetical protein
MTAAAPGLDLAGLTAVLARTDPAALLVPPRILRRVIKQDCGLTGFGFQVPHYKTYVIGRDALLRIADRGELGIPPDRDLPETVILLQRPDAKALGKHAASDILLKAWRLLFHARVHIMLGDRKLDEPAVVERIRRLGTAVFNEARSVLRQEHFLLPPGDEQTVYEEFAALYLELRYFARHLVPRYFPAITDFEGVDRLLAEDVNAEELFDRTRPDGAPLPESCPEDAETTSDLPAQYRTSAPGAMPPERADGAAARGNDVRAARLHFRAGRRAEALDALHRLTRRLQEALHFPPAEEAHWHAALEPLLQPAARGPWPVEARLLYDLQKVCVNQEKEIYAVDFVEWAVTWGQRPVKRLLPHQPFVLAVKHVRRALHRLSSVDMPDEARRRLHRLLDDALHHAEGRLRRHLRPLVVGALDAADLQPANYAERLARDQVVEELLDRVVARSFLTMSDVRDALARNRLKLPDVANPIQVLTGDKLIRANRRLAVALDGVYRRGEIYLRWLQRLSSVFFGTAVGRFLVLYVIVPLACGAFAIKGPKLLWDELRHFGRLGLRMAGLEPAPPHHEHHSTLSIEHADILPIAVATAFFLGLIHWPALRRAVGAALHWLFLAVRFLLFEAPKWFLELPAVRRVLYSRAYLLLYQFVLKPGSWAAVVALAFWLADYEPLVIAIAAGATAVAAELLLNSRTGMRVEEALTDALVRGWDLLKTDILPGLFRRVMAFFKMLVEGVDRVIYTVDEWLRFRTGDSRLSLVVKPVVGLVWFFITYIVRFAVNLLIEPQINPIKHFPVVTVSHKLLLPLAVPPHAGEPSILAQPLLALFPLSVHRANVMAGTIVFGIPGIFGFLVWELKENWKLYRANQSDELDAVSLGAHGETMLRLMRPGFHSGTLPKLYAKLRRYERRHQDGRARKRLEELRHVEEAVKHFAERSLVAVLEGSRGWRRRVFVGAVHAATDEIRIEIDCVSVSQNAEIAFEEQSGWLVGGVSQPGWLCDLGHDECLVLSDALAGFYKLAGVNLVREQVAEILTPGAIWSMRDEALVLWQNGQAATQRLNDPAAVPWERIRFDRAPVRWADWVAAWQRDQDGKGHEPPLLPGVRLLPEPAAVATPTAVQ